MPWLYFMSHFYCCNETLFLRKITFVRHIHFSLNAFFWESRAVARLYNMTPALGAPTRGMPLQDMYLKYFVEGRESHGIALYKI